MQHSQVDDELPLLQKKTYLTYHLINLPEHEHGLANYGPGLVWVSVITDNLQGYHEHQNKYAMLQWTLGGREAHLETLEEVESCKCYGRVEMDTTKGIRGWWKVAQEEGGHLHTSCVHQLTHSRTHSPCHIRHVMSLSISSLLTTLWFTFNMIHHHTLCTHNIKMQGWWGKEVSPTGLPNSVPTWVTCKSTPSLPSVFYCFAHLTCPLNHILHSSKWQPQTDSYTILLSWHEWHRYCLIYNGSLWLRMLQSEVSSCVITC